MKKTIRIRQKTLPTDNKSFDEQLALYREPRDWESLESSDRERLALLFISQGDRLVTEHRSDANTSYEKALAVSPTAAIFLLVGQAYAEQANDPTCLALAHDKLAMAIKLDSNNAEAWHCDGAVLVMLGMHYQELGYLKEGERCLSQAISLHEQQGAAIPSALLGDAGDCWHAMGRQSGEAYDFWKAVELYRKALKDEASNAGLWSRYGQSVESLARLVGKEELLREAIDSYCQTLALDPHNLETHIHLAGLYLRLYNDTNDATAMHNAEQAFKTIINLEPKQVEGWLGLAILLTRRGERQRDINALKESVEKYQQADACEPNAAVILNGWGEALTILGAVTENLHLLREGSSKILKALEIEPDNSIIWRTYATCLTEMGGYFNDESHYLEALDKVKIGLRHDEFNPSLWAVLARIYCSLGNLRGDIALLEEACKYYAKAAELYQSEEPHLFNEWGICLMRLTEATHERRYIEEAVNKFERAITINEENDNIGTDMEWFYNYGCALDFLGDFTDSPEHYEKAIKILTHVVSADPSFRHGRYNLAMAWAHLAELTAEVEFFLKAIEHFETLVQEDNEDEVTWNELGITLINLSQLLRDPTHPERSHDCLLQAEQRLQQAIALGNIQAFYSMACLYSLLKNYELAMHFLEKADHADALPALDDLLHDEWLEGLRHTSAFRQFLQHLKGH